MPQYLFRKGGGKADLGDPLTLLEDYAGLARAVADNLGLYPELFAAPEAAADGLAVGDDWVDKVSRQAKALSRHHRGDLTDSAKALLDRLATLDREPPR